MDPFSPLSDRTTSMLTIPTTRLTSSLRNWHLDSLAGFGLLQFSPILFYCNLWRGLAARPESLLAKYGSGCLWEKSLRQSMAFLVAVVAIVFSIAESIGY